MFQKLSQITFCLVLGLSHVLTQDQGIRQKVKMVIAKLADFRDNDIPYFLTPEDGECDPSIVTEFPRGLKNLCKGLGEGEKVCICAPKRPCLRPAGGLEEVKEVLENPQDLEFEKECRKCQMAWPRGEDHDVLREDSCQRSGGPAELLGNLGQRIKKIQQIRQKLLE